MNTRHLIIILMILIKLSIGAPRLKYRSSVKENVDLYHTVTSLDEMLNSSYQSGQQTIEFLNSNSLYATYFLVDGQKLRTSRLIDREEFCRIKLCEKSICRPCEIEMDFVLKEFGGQPKDIISLILNVEDVNEFRPQFEDKIELNISEGVPVGHVLPIPSATDKDGDDDELVYWLDDHLPTEQNQHQHHRPSKRLNPFELVSFALNVTEPLDREMKSYYELYLTATDRGNLTSSTPVKIYITDINDHIPVFEKLLYIINISESQVPSFTQPLLTVHAYDNDSNENGHVKYNFSNKHSQDEQRLFPFRLDDETGQLFLIKQLDYEQYKEYRLQISAQDCGPGSVPVYGTIMINVEDENDNQPTMNLRISEYFLLSNDTLYISEDTPVQTLLMHIIVQDLDSGLNGEVKCWIESTDDDQRIKSMLNITNSLGNMFTLYTTQIFDREIKSTYGIQIIVEDLGVKQRQRTTRQLYIIINDINDEYPKFKEKIYEITIPEETLDVKLKRVKAIDLDSNENGRITYQLISDDSNDQHHFYINSATGELKLLQKVDHEEKSLYNLTIKAEDNGYPTHLSTNVSYIIHVSDINDHHPIFEKQSYIFNDVREDSPLNTSIGFVRAFDKDDGNNSLIEYKILNNDKFIITKLTGELFTNDQLDFDVNITCYEMIVLAIDNGQPIRLNSTTNVQVCLQGVNEYKPDLVWPKQDEYSINAYINILNASSFILHANDNDRSLLSNLTFQFDKNQRNETVLSLFNLNSNGTLEILNKDLNGIYELSIIINDNEQPYSKLTYETIRLLIYDNILSRNEILLNYRSKTTTVSTTMTVKETYLVKTTNNLKDQKLTMEMFIIFITVILFCIILIIICFISCISCRKRFLKWIKIRQNNQNKTKNLLEHHENVIEKPKSCLVKNSNNKRFALLTTSQSNRKGVYYAESHCLLNDNSIGGSGSASRDSDNNSPYNKLQASMAASARTSEDTVNDGSSYNDSCYGSSDMEMYHNGRLTSSNDGVVHPSTSIATNESTETGKILLNENYIIIQKDNDINIPSPFCSSLSSTTNNNNNNNTHHYHPQTTSSLKHHATLTNSLTRSSRPVLTNRNSTTNNNNNNNNSSAALITTCQTSRNYTQQYKTQLTAPNHDSPIIPEQKLSHMIHIRRLREQQQQQQQSKLSPTKKDDSMDFFKSEDEYRKILNSTTLNITPLNEYYL
ncbi:unnamed protein product [Didymodactylos carnosus]|uniref:Cadherin domain-containing protein n=1 Tax=Didymodactylos carnosus TaxID=1234261 RepID=A0A813VQL3_9BILA|nr:unnamed protein product [Didymodactylos carnosus]CAF3627205.1 unnamed protein product [Didymodactylos carnosus]